MRTTLDLPEDLLVKAMTVTNTKTKTKVIIVALQELIRKATISELKEFKGTIDLNIDLDELRDRSYRLKSTTLVNSTHQVTIVPDRNFR